MKVNAWEMVVVEKRNPFIDHEEFKVKIKLSAGTNMSLQQDMFRSGLVSELEMCLTIKLRKRELDKLILVSEGLG